MNINADHITKIKTIRHYISSNVQTQYHLGNNFANKIDTMSDKISKANYQLIRRYNQQNSEYGKNYRAKSSFFKKNQKIAGEPID